MIHLSLVCGLAAFFFSDTPYWGPLMITGIVFYIASKLE